jgi:4'-phosphopantetheinyl transferase
VNLGLDDGEVLVCLGRPDEFAPPAATTEALALLPADERDHVARFRFERDRTMALASRALQRRALSDCCDVAPAAWRFVRDANGRPHVTAPAGAPPLAWNASNTRGLVGCAVAADRGRTRALGLDLEPWRDDAPAELIEACFTARERAALAALPASYQARRFVELWTLKEAYIKARGLGLDLPLELITVELDHGPPRLVLDPELGDDAARWQLAGWSPTPDHAAAVCVRRGGGPPLTIRTRWMDPAAARSAAP